jgi:hypothetical protein
MTLLHRRISLALFAIVAVSCSREGERSSQVIEPVPEGGTTPTTVVASPPTDTSFTFCLNVGNVCAFAGIRDVRLVASNGSFVVQRDVNGYPGIPCAAYAFTDTLSGAPQRCDFGPIKWVALANPNSNGMGLLSTVYVPRGDTGVTIAMREPTSFNGLPVQDGLGAFRTTCNIAKFAFDDPIVYPNQPGASHLHMFFGNTAITGRSTAASIANSGGSTCRGGILNRSAYWIPALYDTVTKEFIAPRFGQFYYKSGSNVDVTKTVDIPPGLRMIAGDKAATGPQPHIGWSCGGVNQTGLIPDCVNGVDLLTAAVEFPLCWDGRNLDSPDHKSHMAYVIYQDPPLKSYCPATHPVQLPQISEQFDFPILKRHRPDRWRLTSDMYSTTIRGGRSLHADWMLGWDQPTIHSIVVNCLQKGLDCGVGTIGGGQHLTYP